VTEELEYVPGRFIGAALFEDRPGEEVAGAERIGMVGALHLLLKR